MGTRGLHPAAVARTTPTARRGRALGERLAMLSPALLRRVSAWVLRLPPSPPRRAVIAYTGRRAYAAISRGDWELNTVLMDPGAYQLNSGDLARIAPDFEPSYRGVDGYLAAHAVWAEVWDKPEFRFEDFIEAERGTTLVSLIRFVGRGSGSGMALDQLQAHVFTVRDGMVVEQTLYWDRAAGLQAAGLDPGWHSTPR